VILIPSDLSKVIDAAWEKTRDVPGFLLENKARFVGLLAACTPAEGLIVEIGSFKGRSTVMLASVAAHYGLGPVVAIDPHNFNLSTTSTRPGPSTLDDFLRSLHTAGLTGQVEFHHAFSKDVGKSWTRPIRLLWIDGDHSYTGAKTDFDRLSAYVNPHGIVALHDSLNPFPGPIRVFVEDMLRSQKCGGGGIRAFDCLAQYRPEDGQKFAQRRASLESRAKHLIPLVQDGPELHGLKKLRYKVSRSRVPRKPQQPAVTLFPISGACRQSLCLRTTLEN